MLTELISEWGHISCQQISLYLPYRPFDGGGGGGGGGRDLNIKQVGVLIVSLRGVNLRFWSRLGC